MFLVQEAARSTLFGPAPGPVSPQHYLGPIVLQNAEGMQVHILPTGATIQRLIVPNQQGVAEDVVLGFDDATQYQVRFWKLFPDDSRIATPHNTTKRHQSLCPV